MEFKERTYTREDIVRILDADIKYQASIGAYWEVRAREYKESALRDYDAGKPIFVEREECHEDGADGISYAILYYSDGSAICEFCGYNE